MFIRRGGEEKGGGGWIAGEQESWEKTCAGEGKKEKARHLVLITVQKKVRFKGN